MGVGHRVSVGSEVGVAVAGGGGGSVGVTVAAGVDVGVSVDVAVGVSTTGSLVSVGGKVGAPSARGRAARHRRDQLRPRIG